MILTDEPDRTVYGAGASGAHHLVPEITLAGWSVFRNAQPGHLEIHRHSDAYEFHLIVDGEVDWVVADEHHRLRAGDVFMTRPGEPHGGSGGVMHPCALIWFLLARSAGCGDDAGSLDHDLDALDRLGVRRFRATPAIAIAFRRMLLEHADPDARSADAVRATLRTLLIDLGRSARARTSVTRSTESIALSRATEYLARDFSVDASVRGACAAAGLSRGVLNRLFVEQLGLTMIAWRNRARGREAARRLHETQDAITNIAVELGFSSSQHFSTAFRNLYGISPSQYRRRVNTQTTAQLHPSIEWTAEIERRHRTTFCASTYGRR